MGMTVVQTFNRPGWPPDSTVELRDDAAAALFTAGRDYEAEKHTSLHGDYLVDPVGGDRTLAEVIEMRSAFRAPRTSAEWLTIGRGKYNMDPRSTAIPSLSSPHLTGECLDISDGAFLAWLKSPDPHRPGRNIAARYGLVFTLLKENDPRHAQFFPGLATAALDVHGLNTSKGTPTMYAFSYTAGNGTVETFLGNPGMWVKGCAATEPAANDIPVKGPLSLADLNATMWNLGFDDIVTGTVDAWQVLSKNCVGGKTLDTTAWKNAQAAATLTDAQLAKIGAAVKVPTLDLAPILAALAALDKQADDYQAQVEALIRQGLSGTITISPKA